MTTYDRWLCDGPHVYCDACGAPLGRLHDGEGQVCGDLLMCDDCAADEAMRRQDEEADDA